MLHQVLPGGATPIIYMNAINNMIFAFCNQPPGSTEKGFVDGSHDLTGLHLPNPAGVAQPCWSAQMAMGSQNIEVCQLIDRQAYENAQ